MFLFKNKYENTIDPGDLPDEKLLALFAETGKNPFIEEIFKRYTHLVFGICLKYLGSREDAKDGVMQIFEEMIEKLREHKIDHLKGWIYSVAKNHCLMRLRKERRQQFHQKRYIQENTPQFVESEVDEHPDNEILIERDGEALKVAMQKLKEEQRKCIDLFYLRKKSYQEIVKLTGYSQKQVKSYIQNGKRNLKNLLLKTW